MDASDKIKSSVANWEEGPLGKDARHVKRASRELERQIDDAQGLQAISIRLDRELIETFKQIAKIHNVGYQPLMREALRRFADAEMKAILTAVANASENRGRHGDKQTVEVNLGDLQRSAA